MKAFLPLVLVLCGLGSVHGALVARYQFGTVNQGADTSGNSRNLTVTGGSTVFGSATINSVSLGTATFAGNPDGASASSYLSRTTGGTGVADIRNLTLVFWANGTTMTNSFNDLAAGSNGAAGGFEVQTDSGTNTNDRIVAYGTGAGSAATGNTGVNSEGVWHQYALSILNGTTTLYVDGVAVSTSGALGTATTGALTQLYFGRGADFNSPTARGWNGSIADAQLYDQALTSGELATLFANPGTVVPEPATAVLGGLGLLGLLRRRRD